MPIAVYCPQCGKDYHVKDELAGRRVRCPNGHVLLVPAAEAELDLEDAAIEVAEPPAATMPSPAVDDNPYAPPRAARRGAAHSDELPTLKVGIPAAMLIGLGCLGLVFSVLSAVMALVGEPPQIDPQAPPFLQSLQEGTHGPVAAVIQIVFVFVNALVIIGAIQMLRFRSWGLALAASIAAMLNISNCCCVPGIPVGIWAVIVLSLSDVREAFERVARG